LTTLQDESRSFADGVLGSVAGAFQPWRPKMAPRLRYDGEPGKARL